MRGGTGTGGTWVCAAIGLAHHVIIQIALSFALIHRGAGRRRSNVQRRGRGSSVCTMMTGTASIGFRDARAQHGATERARAQCTANVEQSGHAVAAHHHDAVLGTVDPAVGTLVGYTIMQTKQRDQRKKVYVTTETLA